MRTRILVASMALALASGAAGVTTSTVVAGPASSTTSAVGDAINPLTPTSTGDFVELDDWIYFSGFTSERLYELWRTDGEVVELVADIEPGASSSFVNDLVAFGDWVYFTAETAETGSELWRSDGSITEIVIDLAPGSADARPRDKIVFGDELYFIADTGLWRFDGANVQRVPEADGFPIGAPVELNGWLFFAGSAGIARTDGERFELVSTVSVRGDRELFAGSTPPAALGDWLYFAGETPEYGNELWRTDGVVTELVVDIVSGPADAEPFGLTAFDGWVYFGANAPGSGAELVRSNGDVTQLVADISEGDGPMPGRGSSYPGEFEVLDDWLYFRAETADVGAELWRTRGSTTERFADIAPGPSSSEPRALRAIGDSIYFSGPLGLPWRTDGAGVERVGADGDLLLAGRSIEWASTTFTPVVPGLHTFVLEWTDGGNNKIEVREAATGRWVGADTSDAAPKFLTVDLEAGVEYSVATWPGGARIVSVIAPEWAGGTAFAGTVDAERVVAPRWTSSIFVPTSSGDHTLSLDWVGSADVRLEVRNADTGEWLAAATNGPAPRSVTVDVSGRVPYRFAVWATSGSADFEVTADAAASAPEVLLSGGVDAERVVAPKWVATTFTADTAGVHELSFGEVSNPNLRMEVREAGSGVWVAAGGPMIRGDLAAGVVYRLAVWIVDGTADFEVGIDRPAG